MGMAVADTQFHVLAVDDSLVDRKLIERLLKHSSFQVTTVDSGSKALEFLGFREEDELQCLPNEPSVSPNSENRPEQQVSDSARKKDAEVNLVITDYCMPGMTGYDLLKKIKESSSLRNIPVVIMSSENVPSRINRCLEEGAEEFFLKPVKLADVNKLKPHMLRAKYGDESKQVKPQQIDDLQQEPELKAIPQIIQQQPQLPQPPQQQEENNNKRKSIESSSANHIGIEEGYTPDRTRPRYSGLAVL